MNKRLTEIDQELEALYEEKEQLRKRRMWTCNACEKRTQISKITIIDKLWHVPPSGCMGGDYWKSDEEYYVECPKCEEINRICNTFVQVRALNIHVDEEKTHTLLKKERYNCRDVLQWHQKSHEWELTNNRIRELEQENGRR